MTTRLRILAALLAAALAPAALASDAACSLLSSSYADSVLNSPRGEDTEFFVSSGGVPNIMFLFDNSGSMKRLPPDGASQGWGTFERPGNNVAFEGFGCTNAYANALTFHSSCGTTTWDGLPFNGGNDYAQAKDSAGRYCSYMISGNQPPATDRAGFDPDFYPKFFAPTRVYHDALNAGLGTPDGWSDGDTSPHAAASLADFCNGQATQARKDSCNACLVSNGYWFDGSYRAEDQPCGSTADCARHGKGTCIKDSTDLEWNGANDNTAHCRVPNVWFSGNFLNFYPPKFLMARKVMKDTLASVRKIRLGLTTFGFDEGGLLDEKLNPACNMLGSPSSFDANRSSVKAAVNAITFDNWTPLAETLLDIGRLYASSSLTWFSNAYEDASFKEGSASNQKTVCYSCQQSSIIMITDGLSTKDGKIPGPAFAAAPMTTAASNTAGVYAGAAGYNITGIGSADCPVCNTGTCSSSGATCDTSGAAPAGCGLCVGAESADASLAPGTCDGDQESGACDDADNPIPAYLPKVAWYLHNVDLRPNDQRGADGFVMDKKQTLNVYTIGLGTAGNASRILDHAATAGGGLFNGGSGTGVTDARSLRDAIERSLDDVSNRSISFGAASLSTLQASSTQGVLVPRFEPSRSAHWNGHLYAFSLYSEFADGCYVPVTGASGPANKDYDCDGKCTSVFLKDADGAFVQEDGTGAFKKNSPADRIACGANNRCATCATASSTDAKPFWDAGEKLAPVKKDGTANGDYTSWTERKIYTVYDSSGDRKLTTADPVIELHESKAAELAPYLNIQGSPFCYDLAHRLANASNPVATTIRTQLAQVPKVYTECAKVVIQYVRGADVFNERSCSGFPGTYCSRAYQLGDVFHSSPVEVWPPLPSDGLLCGRGLHSQCLPALYEGEAKVGYDGYSKHAKYKNRDKFTLVGANDGMLHAFLTGVWRAGADDPTTPFKEDEEPFEGHYDGAHYATSPNKSAMGKELWAFVPPDLLAKLTLLLGNQHQYYVDATPMVRDVWIDGGVANGLGGATDRDRLATANEFHTVAVVGERRGGTHYFALDVTDAGSDLDSKPRFMWLYPQPTDPEQLAFGETYADFAPTPPPIGPVAIDAGTPPCAAGTVATADGARCYEPRWITFLSGGFDAQYTKGRGVHMVDVASGAALWNFSQPAGAASACGAGSDPRCHLNFPVAATVSMMIWGDRETRQLPAGKRVFDTATFGDTGGQLWLLRFSEPGTIDVGTGKVTNWFGARIFQQGKGSATPECALGFCGAQPFFYGTANVQLLANGVYRVLAGTGDRYNLLDAAGGTCGPDNPRACLVKGCSVKIEGATAGTPGATYGVAGMLGSQAYRMVANASCAATDTTAYSRTDTAGGGASCTGVTARVDRYTITCPRAVTCSGADESTTKLTSIECAVTGGAVSCRPTSTNENGIPIDVKGNPDKRNWFYSVRVFEDAGARMIFEDLPGAIAYDQARLSEASLVDINAADGGGSFATPDSAGWKYYFDHGGAFAAQAITIAGQAHDIYRNDERVASATAVEAGCTFFNTMQTATPRDALDDVTLCPVNSPCKAGRAQLSYTYGLHPGTGGKCMYVDGVIARSSKSETLVPPHIGKLVVYASSGQLSFGLTSIRVPQGGSNIALGEVEDIASSAGWLPPDRALHDCRHTSGAGPAPTSCR